MADVGVVKYQVELDDSKVGQQADKTQSTLVSKFGGAAKKVGAAALSASAAVVSAATAATVDLTKQAVAAYADFQQLWGGIDKLYGVAGMRLEDYAASVGKTTDEAAAEYDKLAEAALTVSRNADEAFRTVGMSSNDYMRSITGFSAALINSLGNDTQAAADMADVAMRDIADNANTFGKYTVDEITEVYQALAKGNFQTLDNLNLGFGGTKEGMQALIDKANELGAAQGKNSKLTIDSFADIVEAIHRVQENMNIAGTTEHEAAGTISGSIEMVKAAWENLVLAVSQGGEWDLDKYIDDLVTSIEAAAGNILPVVEYALQGIAELVSKVAPMVAEKLPGMITDALPGLLTAGVQAADALADGIIQAIPSLLPTVMDIIGQLGKMIIDKAPDIIKCGLTIIVELAKGIAEALPELIPAAVDAILEIVDALTQPDSISMIIEAAIQLILALADGLLTALPRLIERIPDIVENIVTALIDNLPKLIAGLVTLVIEICKHLPEIIAALIQAIPEIISAIIDAFSPLAGDLADSFGSAWDSVKEGFSAAGDWFKEHWGATWDAIKNNPVVKAISDFITNTFNTLKDALGKIWDGIKEAAAGAWDLIKNVLGGAVLVIIDLVTGDFDKLKEDVAHIWENIKDAIDRIFGGIKDAARAALDAVKSIGSDAIATFKNVVSSIKDAIQALPGIIKDKFNQAVDFIKQLPSQALEWGRDLIGKFVEGLKQKWNDLKNSLHNTAQTIRSYLHFSKPDVGPLKDFDSYAPDMVDLFTKGIKDNIGKLESGIGSMTDVIAGSFSADVGYNLPDIAGYASDLSAAITASSAMEIIIPLNVDGREIARASAVYMNEQLAWESR